MDGQRVLTWAEVAGCAKGFTNWSAEAGEREVEWFRRAWECVVAEGLAAYASPLDRCRVALRFLALGFVYQDFLHFAIDQWCEPAWEDVADALELHPIQLGVLMGDKDRDWLNDTSDPSELYREALYHLTYRERPVLHDVLSRRFGAGGQYGDGDVFLSLWRIARQEAEDVPSDEEVFERADLEPAFAFVCLDRFFASRWY